MVKVSSLCVGKELLIGKTVNTNAYWIGARLLALGIMLDRILTVTDSLPEIASGLTELLSRGPDFIVVIGGLGPTPDDMTLRGVAQGLAVELRSNKDALDIIRAHYVRRGLGKVPMTKARRKMAVLPEGSVPVVNGLGTAPAVRIERTQTVIYCLPGVPKEMEQIFKQSVEPEIRRKVGKLYPSRTTMQLQDVFESNLAPSIYEAVRAHPDAYIKSHPKGIRKGKSHVELDIVVTSRSKKESKRERDEIVDFFERRVREGGGKLIRKVIGR
ncbi:MAG: molybdopterin-binding protein [Thaumarchaeota archaeon]|nr:molybdopterin-binding protein [Nitrososphaerota archaeon]